jgi:hypothetical protein
MVSGLPGMALKAIDRTPSTRLLGTGVWTKASDTKERATSTTTTLRLAARTKGSSECTKSKVLHSSIPAWHLFDLVLLPHHISMFQCYTVFGQEKQKEKIRN